MRSLVPAALRSFPCLRLHRAGEFCARSWVALVLLLGTGEALSAQVIQGRLVEEGTARPVAGATITLLGETEGQLSGVMTDASGHFLVYAPAPGRYRLRASRIGYAETVSPPIEVGRDERVEIEFRISEEAVVLEPITVTARSRSRLTPGRELFARRQERGLGVFLTAEDIRAADPIHVTDVLEDVEGMEIAYLVPRDIKGATIRLWDGRHLIARKGWGCMRVIVDALPLKEVPGERMHRIRTSLISGGRQQIEPPPDDVRSEDLNADFRPEDIAGIEVYRNIQEVPEELRFEAWPGQQPCGLVVVWTHAAW